MGAFYRRWLGTALTQSVGAIDLWTGLIAAVLGIIDHYWPAAHIMTAYAWQIPIWILAAVVVMRLLLAPSWMAKEDAQKSAGLEEKIRDLAQTHAKLEIGEPRLFQDTTFINQNSWRMRISNRGPATATNVIVRLWDSKPVPTYGAWQSDFPYDVRRLGHPVEPDGCGISNNGSEDFEIIASWQSAQGALFTKGMDTKRARADMGIGIDTDEKWELSYRVTADNSDSIDFVVRIYVSDGAVVAERKP